MSNIRHTKLIGALRKGEIVRIKLEKLKIIKDNDPNWHVNLDSGGLPR